jgi:hypothetical protein
MAGRYKTTSRDKNHLAILAGKYPENSYRTLIKKAGLNITSKTYAKETIQKV